jgi:hypothetical protein
VKGKLRLAAGVVLAVAAALAFTNFEGLSFLPPVARRVFVFVAVAWIATEFLIALLSWLLRISVKGGRALVTLLATGGIGLLVTPNPKAKPRKVSQLRRGIATGGVGLLVTERRNQGDMLNGRDA